MRALPGGELPKRLKREEIGRLAGVSRSTVSRVINGERNVSPDARARVEAVIAETGYRPHAAARSLASNRTGNIGIVIANSVETLFDDPYFGRLIMGVTTASNLEETTVSLFLSNDASQTEAVFAGVTDPGLVDGVIVTATWMGDPLIDILSDAGMPFVVVGRPEHGTRLFSVDADNHGGARLAAAHLVEQGRERFGIITAPSNTTAGIDRREGFIEGLAEAGFTVEGRVFEGDWSEASVREGMAHLLAGEAPDAVCVCSDRMAVGALRAIRDSGLRCPDDIALASFDGILPEDQTVPRLTAVAQPVFEAGEQAARLLQSLIDGNVTEPQQILLPTSLVVRESSVSSAREEALR
jgi:DNA-binding LacI/PurR family transcriptional regulator